MNADYANREGWLQRAVGDLRRDVFAPVGYQVPDVQVAVGWPGDPRKSRALGVCIRIGEHRTPEVFITPAIDEPLLVLETLTHELVHAIAPYDALHGPAFRTIAEAVGLTGQMRQARADDQLAGQLHLCALRLGYYPHQAIPPHDAGTTRYVPKARGNCPRCGTALVMTSNLVRCNCPGGDL